MISMLIWDHFNNNSRTKMAVLPSSLDKTEDDIVSRITQKLINEFWWNVDGGWVLAKNTPLNIWCGPGDKNILTPFNIKNNNNAWPITKNVITERVKYQQKVPLGTGTEFHVFKCEQYPSPRTNFTICQLWYVTYQLPSSAGGSWWLGSSTEQRWWS